MFHCGTAAFHSYKYDTIIQIVHNDSMNIAACLDPLKTEDMPEIRIEPSLEDSRGKNDLAMKNNLHWNISDVDSHSSKPAISKNFMQSATLPCAAFANNQYICRCEGTLSHFLSASLATYICMDGNVGLSVIPPIWAGLKYLNNNWMEATGQCLHLPD